MSTFRATESTRATAEDRVTFWMKVVDVDAVRAFDITLFRLFACGIEVG
jgi:hypothetical protein